MLVNLFGITFGGYGLFFLVERIFFSYNSEPELNSVNEEVRHPSSILWLYVFIFHRILTMGGDLLPSLDRAAALLFPLKFHCFNTPCISAGTLL